MVRKYSEKKGHRIFKCAAKVNIQMNLGSKSTKLTQLALDRIQWWDFLISMFSNSINYYQLKAEKNN
jgi:hypothetical protein